MGMPYVEVTVRNPAQRARAWTGAFLVDTGAIDSLAPRRTLEAIELDISALNPGFETRKP